MERYRIQPDAAVYFVTYSIVEWLPIFVTEATFKIVTDSLTYCHRHKHLRINALVIMPTHMHMTNVVICFQFFPLGLADPTRLARALGRRGL